MPGQPNIVLFLTDDHGRWANGCYGNREVRTPTLDKLAAGGALFENAFTPSPVCSPARACLLTGRTASQVGIHDWLWEDVPEIGDKDWLAGEVTLPEILSKAGYTCGLSGKWHLGRSHETPRGFDWCFGMPRGQGAHDGTYTYHQNGVPVTLTGNKTQLVTEHALTFLDDAPNDRPFFLNIGYIATHSPYHASAHDPRIVGLYDHAAFEEIPEYYPHPWVHNEGLRNGPMAREELRPYYAGYYSGATEIDNAVSRVVERLREQGRLENTLIVYVSDHGCSVGQQGFWGKGNSTRPVNMCEVSLRVPLIMHWPGGIAPRTRVAECVTHYDAFQTLVELAGASAQLDPARNYPGRTFSRLLITPDPAWDNLVVGEYGDTRMARTPRWKLIVRYGHGPDELFDLVSDPLETASVAGRPETSSIQAELTLRLERFYARHEAPDKTGLNAALYPPQSAHSPFHDGIRESRFS